MNKLMLIGVVIILGAAGVFMFSQGGSSGADEAMMQEKADAMNAGDTMPAKDDAMMKKDDVMMQKDDAMMQKDASGEMMKDESAMMKTGSYVAYAPERLADAVKGKVVLFFRAGWCPTCRSLDKDIRANAAKIPAGVTILDVDYDTATSLKQKYGVTSQHTLVQVDAQGNQIAKWGGSSSLAALVGSIK
ncbi:thioredoxin family protein [Candidatus Kaiserbacteria bacterium]|nr:thioredoxin family protein [Candidatus Kaiserbacteria bacterium]